LEQYERKQDIFGEDHNFFEYVLNEEETNVKLFLCETTSLPLFNVSCGFSLRYKTLSHLYIVCTKGPFNNFSAVDLFLENV
jgi:hypothetical protein